MWYRLQIYNDIIRNDNSLVDDIILTESFYIKYIKRISPT
jgi:hypothetical protein